MPTDFQKTVLARLDAILEKVENVVERLLGQMEQRSAQIETLEGAAFRLVGLILGAQYPYLAGHGETVEELAVQIAARVKFPPEQLRDLRIAARIHDCGKLAIDQTIIEKPSLLTPEQRLMMQHHPTIAYKWMRECGLAENIALYILHHHEHWDGSGYPAGLAGRKIPFGARILQVADVYDALVHNRPYRPALSEREALALMRREAQYYDADCLAALDQIVNEEHHAA